MPMWLLQCYAIDQSQITCDPPPSPSPPNMFILVYYVARQILAGMWLKYLIVLCRKLKKSTSQFHSLSFEIIFSRKHLLITKSVQHINPFLHKCKLPKQEKYSSRMRTTRFPFCPRCQYWWGEHWPQVNKFEQVSSDGHQMSLAGLGLGITLPDVLGGGRGWGWWGMGPHAWCPGAGQAGGLG